MYQEVQVIVKRNLYPDTPSYIIYISWLFIESLNQLSFNSSFCIKS